MDGVGGKFGEEDVVVRCVTDGTTDDTDGEGEGCNGRDEVLKGCYWAEDRGRSGKRMGLTSGQIMVVIMEAGTTMPPMPRPARTRRPQAR